MQFLPDSLETGDVRVRTLNHALHYADIEWPVVPLYTMYLKQGICTCHLGVNCTSPAKHPVPVNGVKAATVKTEVIRQWWEQHPRANIGIATGHGLFVIDIDPRSGGSLEELQKRFALPDTATVRTGGEGWHLYFAYMGTLGNSAGKLGEGIDTRGLGGYVVAPPSLHASGNYYTWLNRVDPVPLPEAIIDALTHPTKKVFAVQTPLSAPLTSPLLDVPIADATQLIQLAKTPSIPEGKRNSSLLSMAGALRQQGATVDAILAALKVINLIQCEPPLTESEVKRIAAAAERWELGQPVQGASVVPQMYTLDVLLNTTLPDPQWAIPTFLPEGVTLLAGKPKMGKSWFALALALAIAENRLALGKMGVTRGDVLYLGLEDSMRRIADRATKLLQGRTPPDNFTWVGAWNLLSAGGLADIEDWLYNHKEARLVVIDTLAKVRPPGTNNSNMYNEDYAVMTPLKAIAESNNVAILVIHHLRKSGAPDVMDTISGTTGLTGATDCNMVLDRERGQNEATLFITGRDVEEQELALSFNPENAQWTVQSGESQRRNMSKERREIVSVLENASGPLAPKEIADELNKNSAHIRKMLYEMVKVKEVYQVKRGLYEPAKKYEV